MARQNSVIRLRGTIGGVTHVKSTEYGDHTRAARGTYKKAKINDTFKKESKALQSSNLPAKILKDAIEPYRKGLEGGQLWQALVSMFRKQLKVYGAFDFGKLEPFEIQEKYPFNRIMPVSPTITVDNEKSKLDINLRHGGRPYFHNITNVDGYKLTVVAIFPSLKKKSALTEVTFSDVLDLESPGPVQLQVNIPRKSERYVICVKIEGYFAGRSIDTRATQGFRAVASGVI